MDVLTSLLSMSLHHTIFFSNLLFYRYLVITYSLSHAKCSMCVGVGAINIDYKIDIICVSLGWSV